MPPDDAARLYRGVQTVVFGATGFIGRWVARRLSESGARLVLPVRDRRSAGGVLAAFDIRGEIHDLDYRDVAAVHAFLQQTQPTVVFNLAGYGVNRTETDATAAERINIDLVAAIGEAVAMLPPTPWRGQRIVNAGTAMEYGARPDDLRESGPTEPTTVYGRTKLAGTRALADCCARHGVRGFTARLFAVYGPGERPERLLPSLVRAAATRDAIPLTAGWHERDFVYVEDAADALLRLGIVPSAGVHPVNVATGVLSSVRSFVETAAGVLGIAPERLQFGALPTRPEEMQHAPVSNDRLRSLTGWVPRIGAAEGVRRTWAFEASRETVRTAHHAN